MYRRRPRKLAPIISAQGLSKTYGVAPLFQNISFTVSEGDRIGVIGPNGSGKSTLLEMLIGGVKPDSGDVAIRKGTRLSYVSQISEFAKGVTIRSVIETALVRTAVPEAERASRFAETLGRAGFADLGVRVRGGQPRPLFPRERRQRDGGTQSRLRGWRAPREGKLQRIPGGRGAVPALAEKAAGVAGEPRSHRARMASPRTEGASYEGEGPH